MLEQAKSNLRNAQRGFRLAAIDAQAIPFANASFDGVIANHMLYHVPDRSKALAELRRVLRLGGRFYISTVGRNHLREMEELVSRFSPGAEFWQEREQAKAFVLETGAEQLGNWFAGVTLHRYDDGLVITEAEPLVAYILSSWSSAVAGDKVAEFTAFVQQKITADGAIRVHKDSGMFACTRA
jgi:SAM-dependent methyltransferase